MAQFMCYCYSFIYIINICFGWNKNSFADHISITVEIYMNCCIISIRKLLFFPYFYFLCSYDFQQFIFKFISYTFHIFHILHLLFYRNIFLLIFLHFLYKYAPVFSLFLFALFL